MNRILYLTLSLGCALILIGCNENPGSTDNSQAAELISTMWMLHSIDVPDSTSIEVDTNKTFSIQFFEDLHIRGINDCNEYFGIFTVSANNSVSIDSLVSSFILCSESIDQEYFAALHFVHSYEISNNMLRLFYDDNNSALNYLKPE